MRLCVRRLRGTRTLLKKMFRVPPGSLLFAVFSKACERLRIREDNVLFVHNGAVLSGRREARTLMSGPEYRSVQVFAVCKKAWACKQRGEARRGFVSGPLALPVSNVKIALVRVPSCAIRMPDNFETVL